VSPLVCRLLLLIYSICSFQIIEALEKASKVAKPPVSDMFTDVYAEMPWHLQEQLQETLAVAQRHPHLCPPDMPVK
jgi:2-oxoisovalerate dehydrogenase E1 component alpha subunit